MNTIMSVSVLLVILAVAYAAKGEGRSLRKPPVPKNSMSFFFWGDWGENVNAAESLALGNSGIDYEEALVAAQVTAYSKIYKPSFYCLLGDNFYNIGVANTTDPLWNDYYNSVYTDPVTMVPWYPVFGNHDYYGKHNPQPEIDFYLEGRDNRWTFPDYQYTRIWKIPGTKQTLQIVFINTVTLCPEAEYGTTDDKIPWPVNPTKSFPNSNPVSALTDGLIAGPTLQWIENTLNASTADILLVAGHYHVYTNTHGDTLKPEGLCLQSRLVPLMQKYGVSAYMHGHEHNFEHFVVNGISYITVGHGCDNSDALAPGTPAGCLFNRTVGGFAHMQVYPNKLHFDFIDENGNNIYNYDFAPRPRGN